MITLLLAALLLISPAQLTEHHADHTILHPTLWANLSPEEMKAELAAYTETEKATGYWHGPTPLEIEDHKIIEKHFPPKLKRTKCNYKHPEKSTPGYIGTVYYAVVVYTWCYPTCDLWG